eukprot:5423257-Prymnesium_polylepis.4
MGVCHDACRTQAASRKVVRSDGAWSNISAARSSLTGKLYQMVGKKLLSRMPIIRAFGGTQPAAASFVDVLVTADSGCEMRWGV